MVFETRYEAALKLIPHLEKYAHDHGVILAVPRGGVPMGYEIARHFHMPLELLMTKKIGHPLDREVAIGAVGLEDHRIDVARDVPLKYIEKQVKQIRKSLKERYRKFVGNHLSIDLQNKTVIIIDDGIATGNTILGSIKMIYRQRPEKIVVAVPVAPVETVAKMKKYVDDLICLYVAENFRGVGLYYADFSEVSDEEVISLLRRASTLAL
ncbi:phosphoribosyltransferase [Chryseolinea soli]|uniref:Phosphoribosyltransferase n=1 Tax=Chryseolinea soli TaxID=2321403 RepID=A0A385STC0_9BACT|nr:phosphoribosyltransferase family protein [Chryseolinea soli]AYB35083.1 phosphoribosyltransferase [Chryseolinea soli]